MAPSLSALVVMARVAKRRRVETSTPYRPPRPHEDVELRSPSSEDYFTPTRGQSRLEPYPSMANGYSVRSIVREMHKTREEPRLSPRAVRPRIINDVRFRDADRIDYADRYIDEEARRAQTGVKQSASFMPPVAVQRTRNAATGQSMDKPKTREMGTQTDSSAEESSWVSKDMRTGRSSSNTSYRTI